MIFGDNTFGNARFSDPGELRAALWYEACPKPIPMWTAISKSVDPWVAEAKAESTWTAEDKQSSTWIEEDKSTDQWDKSSPGRNPIERC